MGRKPARFCGAIDDHLADIEQVGDLLHGVEFARIDERFDSPRSDSILQRRVTLSVQRATKARYVTARVGNAASSAFKVIAYGLQ